MWIQWERGSFSPQCHGVSRPGRTLFREILQVPGWVRAFHWMYLPASVLNDKTLKSLLTLPWWKIIHLIQFYFADFLPMRCDACEAIFCKDHITYASHKCTSSYKKVTWPGVFKPTNTSQMIDLLNKTNTETQAWNHNDLIACLTFTFKT